MKTAEEILQDFTDGFYHSSRLKYDIIEAMKIYADQKLKIGVKEVAKQFYQQNILLAPVTQKCQLEMIDRIGKIENDIILKLKD